MTLHLIWFVRIYYYSARRCIVKGLPIFWTRMAVELIPMSLYQFYTVNVMPDKLQPAMILYPSKHKTCV